MSHPRRSRTAGPRARSRFRSRAHRRRSFADGSHVPATSIRRGQVWTSVVRIAADARAEEHRARMMREADEHAKALALAVADEEICACRLAVTWSEGVPVLATTEMVGGVVQSRTIMVGTALLEANLRDTQREVDRLRTTTPKVPPPRPGAERFEAPLVRDKATARAMGNKYANAPAGTRAAHKRTPPPADSVARAERCAKREQAQRWRRAAGLFFKVKGTRVQPRLPWGVSLHYSDGRKPITCAGSIGRTIVDLAIGRQLRRIRAKWIASWPAMQEYANRRYPDFSAF